MSDEPTFDLEAAHRYFSTNCFNKAWDLIETEERTPADEDEMLNLSLASLWHWTQRADCTKKELSIGYWQVSRIYAITGRPENAMWYAQRCLEVTEDAELPPFYMGYAYEALARAASANRDRRATAEYLGRARAYAAREQSEDDRQLLLDDLATIEES
jgi:hypothetical protein